MPPKATPNQKIMIFFAAEHFIAILIERQQNKNN